MNEEEENAPEPVEEAPPEQPEQAGEPPPEAPEGAEEAELRRRIEEGLRQVRMQDVLLESVVTFINLTARRIGKADERDLEQARIGIEAVRSLVELLEPEPQAQVRNALSELQMLYAQHSGGEPPGDGDAGGGGDAEPPPPQQPPPRQDPGPGLWTPPGS